jgi:hypothetical protein
MHFDGGSGGIPAARCRLKGGSSMRMTTHRETLLWPQDPPGATPFGL